MDSVHITSMRADEKQVRLTLQSQALRLAESIPPLLASSASTLFLKFGDDALSAVLF